MHKSSLSMRKLLKFSVRTCVVLAGAVLITSCSDRETPAATGGTTEQRQLPIDDPGEDILIVFENAPGIPQGQCKPLLKIAMQAETGNQRLRYHLTINGQPHLQMVVAKQRSGYPFAYDRHNIALNRPIDKPCSDIDIALEELLCANIETNALADCGRSVRLQAEEFASITDARE